jgi:serine/threonine-protein kinase
MASFPPGLGAALQDRYRLERELGQGGMATVYLAHDLRNNGKIALKVPMRRGLDCYHE